jgi:hypothetical protein
MTKPKTKSNLNSFHLDLRADQLIALGKAAGSVDEELSLAEVARWLGVCPDWVRLRERDAALSPSRTETIRKPAFHLGRQMFYRRSDVIAFLEKRRRLAEKRFAENSKAVPQSLVR